MTKFYSTKEAARLLGLSQSTLKRWRAQGIGPVWAVIGDGTVRYSKASIDHYQQTPPRKDVFDQIMVKNSVLERWQIVCTVMAPKLVDEKVKEEQIFLNDDGSADLCICRENNGEVLFQLRIEPTEWKWKD